MMVNRRHFIEQAALTAASAIAGSVASAAMSQDAAAQRRRTRIGGRAVKTIDIHAHCVVPEAMGLIAGAVANPSSLIVGPERLMHMNAQGIDVQVLSINQFWYEADRDTARRVVDIQNHRLAEICAAQPDRFVPLATVALQHPDMAAEQLDYAVRSLGMRGVSIAAHVVNDELSAPRFQPFWAEA